MRADHHPQLGRSQAFQGWKSCPDARVVRDRGTTIGGFEGHVQIGTNEHSIPGARPGKKGIQSPHGDFLFRDADPEILPSRGPGWSTRTIDSVGGSRSRTEARNWAHLRREGGVL